MNPYETEELMMQSQLHGQVGSTAQVAAQSQYYLQEQDKTIAEAQLECDKILEKVRHTLKQDKKIIGDDGGISWVEIAEENRTLTDAGVERIMQTMESYVNKESLLSNYDDKIIARRMLEFSLALNGLLFMKYEVYFRLPTIEEAITIIKRRIEQKNKVKIFSLDLMGVEYNPDEIKKNSLIEIESRIEYEIEKVRKQKQRQNQMEYELLFTEIKAIVESVHQRAFRGEERGSLRRHTNIAEIIGGSPSRGMEKGGMSKWLRGM